MDKAKIDPICGMKGHIHAHGHWFCSEHCIRKYEKKNNIQEFCPECIVRQKRPWYKNKLLMIFFFIVIVLIISNIVSFMYPFYEAFMDYLGLIWWAIFLGLLIGGVIDYFIPREYIEKYLGQHKKRTIFYAVGFGFLMSACSHGILAIAIELYKKGASTASVIAFLLASPWANFPLTILFFSFFGWKALLIVASAIIIAIISGLIFQTLEKEVVSARRDYIGREIISKSSLEDPMPPPPKPIPIQKTALSMQPQTAQRIETIDDTIPSPEAARPSTPPKPIPHRPIEEEMFEIFSMIDMALEHGDSIDNIKQSLHGSGYRENLVDEALKRIGA